MRVLNIVLETLRELFGNITFEGVVHDITVFVVFTLLLFIVYFMLILIIKIFRG